MSGHHSQQPFPRTALIGAGALLMVTLLAAGGSRLAQNGATQWSTDEPAFSMALRFEDQADGSVAVFLDDDAQALVAAEPGGSGFIRGVLRGLGRERKLLGISASEPYRLMSWSDGRLALSDPATGINIDLESFGATNKEAFARLMRISAEQTAGITSLHRQTP